MSALGGVVQLKSIAIEETVFGSLQDLVAGNEGPGWIG